ncbi:Phosphatidylserine decarboxylase proenzyme [Candidatus Kinetoplastibacterium sorsogonicusi]|uniref:Phosphatidylserine decarboxylase proenzyme n=1 Tax=Candidatus Kinetoplastidibacterium kentomonadis TaxID=1576550 RepID=A0A3Q8F6K6_9PROT|nr:archaetidylserine decarboxylase [Candidatus Kinetoplastibacterium sorsogonicusi]AWD32452.1 Phosphatidylserine decarboxylase proenzyme [Candidatus Kinetoplastibacterium sorsogonicusi]
MHILEKFFILSQYILPKKLISKIFGFFAYNETSFIKNIFINIFIKFYKIDMTIALEKNINHYKNFNEFFTRKIDLQYRQIDYQISNIVSPVDGYISQFGNIKKYKIIQAKNHNFNIFELLGGNSILINYKKFIKGNFITIYLSPKDYHRVHMPIDGKLQKILHIPGKLYSVNNKSITNIPNIYSKNERVILLFNTNYGDIAIIMVGAIIVSSISTIWTKLIKNDSKRPLEYNFSKKNYFIKKGMEIGSFYIGSTVIILFDQEKISWKDFSNFSNQIKMGEKIGQFII